MRHHLTTIVLAVIVPLVGVSLARADKKPVTDVLAFGTLRPATLEEARGQAHDWLKSVGKTDATTQLAFDRIWSEPDRTLLERVTASLALGDEEAARILSEIHNTSAAAPTAVPPVLKDAKQPLFYRANLSVVYAKALCKGRVYEEALEALKSVKPEQVVEPATYLFHRAVTEHSLLLKDDATRSILRLIDDTVDTPERYKLVASLMYLDMQSWKDKDLGWIARKMDNIERRLDLARGGPQTQKMQKDVVARLDELIKQLENQAKGSSQANSGGCPNGGQQQPGSGNGQQRQFGGNPNNPQRDTFGGQNAGPGKVDQKKLEGIAKQWGKLPEKEQVKAMQELIRDMPPEYRELIETYFRKLAQSESGRP